MIVDESALKRRRLRRLFLAHGNRHPIAGHCQKLVSNLLVGCQSGESHAFARIANALFIGDRTLLRAKAGGAGSAELPGVPRSMPCQSWSASLHDLW
jgi:hypothetical protein